MLKYIVVQIVISSIFSLSSKLTVLTFFFVYVLSKIPNFQQGVERTYRRFALALFSQAQAPLLPLSGLFCLSGR